MITVMPQQPTLRTRAPSLLPETDHISSQYMAAAVGLSVFGFVFIIALYKLLGALRSKSNWTNFEIAVSENETDTSCDLWSGDFTPMSQTSAALKGFFDFEAPPQTSIETHIEAMLPTQIKKPESCQAEGNEVPIVVAAASDLVVPALSCFTTELPVGRVARNVAIIENRICKSRQLITNVCCNTTAVPEVDVCSQTAVLLKGDDRCGETELRSVQNVGSESDSNYATKETQRVVEIKRFVGHNEGDDAIIEEGGNTASVVKERNVEDKGTIEKMGTIEFCSKWGVPAQVAVQNRCSTEFWNEAKEKKLAFCFSSDEPRTVSYPEGSTIIGIRDMEMSSSTESTSPSSREWTPPCERESGIGVCNNYTPKPSYLQRLLRKSKASFRFV